MVDVPDDLAGPLARLIQVGLRELIRANGAAAVSPRLVRLLEDLAAADLRSLGPRHEPASEAGSPVADSVSLLSVSMVSERLECSDRWVRHLAASGRLRGATRVGHEWVIPEDGLEEFRRHRGAA